MSHQPEADWGEVVILLAEDFQDARELTAELLRYCGFRVLEAATGPQAVELTRQVLPHAVLMDLGLPSFDGLEATRRLRTDPATMSIPIILLTASTHDERLETVAREAGCDHVLAKPCDPRFLITLLNRLATKTVVRS